LTPILAFWGIEHFTPPWDVFFLPLFNLLIAFYHLVFNDFALAIIVFTIVIRTILAPLFVKQIRSQREMQRMQPLIREVQRKHKGNRQKISEETMAMYKEHGVNPAAGCLPVLLQMPILIALFWALRRAAGVVHFEPPADRAQEFADFVANTGIEPVADRANEYFVPISPVNGLTCNPPFSDFLPLNCQLIEPLELTQRLDTTIGWLLGLDLARIDHVFSIALFGGFAFSALAVVAGILQFVQVKMTSPRPNPDDPTAGMTSTMIYMFPLLTVVWGGIFPSGLILYWIVYTAFLVVHQYLMLGWGNFFPLFGWQPAWARSPDPALMSPPPRRVQPADNPDDSPSTTKAASGKQRRPQGGTGAGQQPRRKKRRGRKR
jgi:YidC/Oxa1 family membrane protein insertase